MTPPVQLRVCVIGLCLAALGGCSTIGGFAGAAASVATSFATANPIVGISVGVGVKAATDEGIRYLVRRRHDDAQDAIAAVIGDLGEGESAQWQLAHRIGAGAEGEVRVTRVIDTALAQCKELLFSVVQENGASVSRDWFATTACRRGDGWRWAAAEPAVERWGHLQ